MPHDTQALLRALDEEPWLTLLALADACEEAGDQGLADGYRFLVGERVMPACFSATHVYSWGFPNDPERPGNWDGRYWLMQKIHAHINRHPGRIDCRRHRFRSAAAAFAAAAEAFGHSLTPAARRALRRRPPRPPSSAPAPAAAPRATRG